MQAQLSRRSFTALLATGVVGCAGIPLATVLPAVVAGITDAQAVISMIAAYIQNYNTNAALKQRLEQAMADTNAALDAVIRAASGAKDINDGNVQKAIADFASAFAALVSLAQQIGIQVGSPGSQPKAIQGGLIVPEPLLLGVARAQAKRGAR